MKFESKLPELPDKYRWEYTTHKGRNGNHAHILMLWHERWKWFSDIIEERAVLDGPEAEDTLLQWAIRVAETLKMRNNGRTS